MSKPSYTIRITSESCDDYGVHSFPEKPSDQELRAYLRKVCPGDIDEELDEDSGPGIFGSYLYIEEVAVSEARVPRKSVAGPRGRKLRELCKDARAQALIDDPDETDIVKLRYAAAPMPKWVGYLENRNVTDIEAVLDALGVP